MKYYVLARQSDKTSSVAEIDDHPEDYPIDEYEFLEGDSMTERMNEVNEDLIYRFSEDNPDGRRLVDLQENSLLFLIVSKKFQTVLQTENNIEFLPITLLDHRGNVASDEYTIANILSSIDCIDFDQSSVRMHHMDPEMISRISKLVLDESKINPDINIFRLEQKKTTVVVSSLLKEKIEEAKLEGPLFVPIEEFDSAYFLGV